MTMHYTRQGMTQSDGANDAEHRGFLTARKMQNKYGIPAALIKKYMIADAEMHHIGAGGKMTWQYPVGLTLYIFGRASLPSSHAHLDTVDFRPVKRTYDLRRERAMAELMRH